MERTLVTVLATVLIAEPALALVGYVAEPKAKGLAIWRSAEDWSACDDERKATGQPGAICFGRAIVAMVDNCTKASYQGTGGGSIFGLGSAFVKVLLLDGPHVGVEGLVFSEQWHSDRDGPCA